MELCANLQMIMSDNSRPKWAITLESIGGVLSRLYGAVFIIGIVAMLWSVADSLFFSTPYSRDFVCSDYTFNNRIPIDEQQKEMQKYLGAKVRIEFYDRHAKITLVSEKEENSPIFTQIGEDTYEYTVSPNNKVRLSLDSPFGFIESAKLVQTSQNGIIHTMTLKRDI